MTPCAARIRARTRTSTHAHPRARAQVSIAIIFVFAYFIASAFLAIFDMSIDTVFQVGH